MIDQLLGRPSATVRRSQIFLVLFFWLWRLYKGDGSVMSPGSRRRRVARRSPAEIAASRTWWRRVWAFLVARRSGPRWITSINMRLRSFTPYQLILGTLTVVYALRHMDDLLGMGAPEPLATMYSRSYYRATYVNTALDAGFATAMTIRPKWLKDICSILFGCYYLVFASEGDSVLRKYRALCSVEMLRTTWEKTNNPYVSTLQTKIALTAQLNAFLALHRPKVPIVRHVQIPRPSTSSRASQPPVRATLFFNGTEKQLSRATELVMDFPGGGFVAMGPECHEERLRTWAIRTGKPVLSIDYGKAPEYPYPWAIEEGIDAYRTVTDSKGAILGIKSRRIGVVLTGDSAGGNICTTIVNRILEHHKSITRPVAIILAYPALDFNYASWMSPSNLQVLQTEQSSTHIPGLLHGKDHLRHKSPLSVVDDTGGGKKSRRLTTRSRKKSWADSISATFGMTPRTPTGTRSQPQSPIAMTRPLSKRTESGWFASREDPDSSAPEEMSDVSDSEFDDEDDMVKRPDRRRDADKSLAERVKTPGVHADERFVDGILSQSPIEVSADDDLLAVTKPKKAAFATRLTMTSRVGYFQDRVISPSMMRAMAILYIGPQRCPDFETDYYISPLLSPARNLAHFPPVYLICGERDPFVDDTVIFAGKLRDAKRSRRSQAARDKEVANAKHGEGLRMTPGKPNEEIPDHILRETDEDWVQMRIIEGWGHGFMQMTSLMREVHSVLIEMADWIDESFERHRLSEKDQQDVAQAHAVAQASASPDAPTVPTTETLPSPLRSRHVKPAREYTHTPKDKVLGGADLGGDFGADDESGGDDESIVRFTPKSKKRTPPPSQFTPVPRRPSKETLRRDNSVPNFDSLDDSASSGETMQLQTPPPGRVALPSAPAQPKGMASFGLFSRPTSTNRAPVTKSASTTLYASAPGSRRGGNSPAPHAPTPVTNPLVKAAVASARAASPALAAAGFAPQSVNNVTQEEMFRRRRAEAVLGMEMGDSDDTGDKK